MFDCKHSAFNFAPSLYLIFALVMGSTKSNMGENATEFGGKTVIYMGGLFAFPESTSIGMQHEIAQTALDHVNSLDGILDGYHLKMRYNWTGQGDPEEGLRVLHTLAYTGPPVPIIWGPLLSREAVIVNPVASRFNIVQVVLASSTALGNRTVYPYTVQAYPNDKDRLMGGAAFFRWIGWRRIACLFEESAFFQEHMMAFREVLEDHGVQLVAAESVKDMAQLDIHLQNLKRQDARITYLGFYGKAATLKVMCQAYLSGMYGAKYVWIAPNWANNVWWTDALPSTIAPCSEEQVFSVVSSSIHLNPNPHQQRIPDLDFNGVKPLPEHYEYFNSTFPFSNNIVPLTYDGIMAIALTLNSSIAGLGRLQPSRRLEDFRYSDEEMARVILGSADRIDFAGLSGRYLIEDGQRKRDTVFIDQAQGRSLVTVMLYKTQEKLLVTSGVSEIKWQGQHVPVDGVTKRNVILEVSATTRAVLFSLASVGAVIALVFLFLNIRFKHKRAIKMSSPPLSNLTVVGCLFLYASVFATGWDKTGLSDAAIITKCHLERILISLGVSFAFGSVFVKTYRIHAIFTVAIKRFRHIDLPDWKLIGGVLTVVFVDCVIFVLWITVDTTTVYSRYLDPRLNMTEPEKEIFDVPVIRYCSSEHAQYFVIALYGVKGILLTFGLFLAWETRNIAVSQLNDSKYIAASVYIVVLTIVLTVPTVSVLDDDVNMTFAVPGVAIVIINTSVLCLNFIPKVHLLLSVDDKDITLSLMQSSGYSESSAATHSGSSGENTSKISVLCSKLDQRKAELRLLCGDLQAVLVKESGAPKANVRTRRNSYNGIKKRFSLLKIESCR